jgi:hypothetical protein
MIRRSASDTWSPTGGMRSSRAGMRVSRIAVVDRAVSGNGDARSPASVPLPRAEAACWPAPFDADALDPLHEHPASASRTHGVPTNTAAGRAKRGRADVATRFALGWQRDPARAEWRITGLLSRGCFRDDFSSVCIIAGG